MTKLSFSQSGYPKKIVYNGDTVIAITVDYMQVINNVYLELQQCRTIDSIMGNALDSCDKLSNLHDSIVENYNEQVTTYQGAIAEKNSIIEQAVDSDRAQKKRIKRLYQQNNVLKGYSIISVAIIAVLLIL